jgi:DNA-binding NarL/FixJ family response regulator
VIHPAGARALIVEDDASWQQILVEIVTDVGLAADIAAEADEAIAQLRAARHRLAVVDLSLSSSDYHNQDGLVVLEALRRHDPGCVSVLLTGYATVELAVQALTECGAFTCLRKEAFNRADFRDLIDRALASAPPASASNGRPATSRSPGPDLPRAADESREPGWALVVEDDAGWRGILSELLSDAGYRVRACASFGEAFGRLRREEYALAVVDLALESTFASDPDIWHRSLEEEDLGGYRLLASTRAGGTPTIVVSGVATPANIERAYDEHAIFAFFEKQTFDRRAFLHTVEEAQTEGTLPIELNRLTGREHEVLVLLAQGLTNREIAEGLVITTNTVKRHLKAIFRKLEVHTRSAAAAKAISAGVSVEWPESDEEAPG